MLHMIHTHTKLWQLIDLKWHVEKWKIHGIWGSALAPYAVSDRLMWYGVCPPGDWVYLQSFNVPDISPNTQSSENDGWRVQMYHVSDSCRCFHPVSVFKFNCVLDLFASAPQSTVHWHFNMAAVKMRIIKIFPLLSI